MDEIDPARTALLVIDMQNGFLRDEFPIGNASAVDIIPGINRIATALRDAGGLVVHFQHTISDAPRFALTPWQQRISPRDADGGFLLQPGNFAHALDARLDRDPRDLTVLKHRFSAFLPNSSDVDETLKARGIDTLIITGVVTNVCCESTARDAYQMGYRIVFVSDGTAARTDEEHNAALLSMATMFGSVVDGDTAIAMIMR